MVETKSSQSQSKSPNFVDLSSKAKKQQMLAAQNHVFLAIIPRPIAEKIARRITFITKYLKVLNPTLKEDLRALDYTITAEEYVGIGFLSYLLMGTVLAVLIYYLAISKGKAPNSAFGSALGIFFVINFIFNYLSVKIPQSTLRQNAVDADRYLIYGLKEMVIHAHAGSSLYECMVSVAQAGYGEVSVQFDWAVRQVNTGMPLTDALNHMVKRTRSEYFRKVIWQLINTIKTGSDLSQMIQPIIDELDYFQKSQIQNYARELNLWSLVYMIFSAAIPTIGSTMLVVLSVFANFGVDELFFAGFALFCLLVQIALIFIVLPILCCIS